MEQRNDDVFILIWSNLANFVGYRYRDTKKL